MQLERSKKENTNTNFYLIGQNKIRNGLDYDEKGNLEMGFFLKIRKKFESLFSFFF